MEPLETGVETDAIDIHKYIRITNKNRYSALARHSYAAHVTRILPAFFSRAHTSPICQNT